MSTEAARRCPYQQMGDEALDAEWTRMLHDYAERLEYFEGLPEWQHAENLARIKDDPDSWGLTRGEFRDWCDLLLEHILEGGKMGAACAERHARLRESERDRVSRLSDPDEAVAVADAHEAASREGPGFKTGDESMLEYVLRVEAANDERALGIGASRGAMELRDAFALGVSVEHMRAERDRARKRREADLKALRERRRGRAGGKR